MKDRQTPAESSREWFLDFLRIAATYGIVMLHMSPLDTDIYGVETAPWKTFICMSILFRWCVPAFFMISGALFLSPRKTLNIKKLYAKTIFRMVCSFLFWSGLYAMAHCIIMDKGKWTFLNQWLRGHYHMWYVFVAIGLYILTPVLRGLTQSRKLTEYYLIIGFVFTYLLPRALSLLLLFNPPHADVIQSFQAAVSQINPLAGKHALYFYVLGYYLHEYPLRRPVRLCLYLAGAASCILMMLLTIWHSAYTGAVSALFYGTESMLTLLFAAGVYTGFRQAFEGVEVIGRCRKVVLQLSACSYGVYLIHPFLLERIPHALAPRPLSLIVGMPLIAGTFYLLALGVSFALLHIPVLKRLKEHYNISIL